MSFREYNQNQIFLLPPSLDEWVGKSHPARVLSEIIERLDVSCLRVPALTGRPAYHPLLLLKVLVWAYAHGVRASRKIEAKLSSDVVFMWLAGFEKPDFRTICLFRQSNLEAINNLFAQMLMVAKGLGMLRLGLVALDGTKIRASAGIGSFKQVKEWRKELKRLKGEVKQILEEAKTNDQTDDERSGAEKRGDEVPKGLEERRERARKIEALLSMVAENDGEDILVSGTDPSARFMHGTMGSLPAYNTQVAATEDQIIVYADVTTEPVDVNQVIPALEGINAVCGKMPEKAVMDAGYGGGKNLKGLEERGVDGYVPESGEENIGKEQRCNPHLYGKSDFQYNAAKDRYRCPAGKMLSPTAIRSTETKYSKHEVVVYRPERGVCARCAQKTKCTTSENPVGRSVSRDAYEEERIRMRQKLKTPVGKKIYGKRKCLVEPVFGQIKVIEQFVQFLLRGLTKVRIEWKWAAIVHNLLKIIGKVQKGEVRLGWAT